MSINDRQIRKLPAEVRRELWTYIPRRTIEGMSLERARLILTTYDRPDLADVLDGYVGDDRER